METGRKKKEKKTTGRKDIKSTNKVRNTMQRKQPIKKQNASKSRVEAGKLKTFALKKGHPRNSRELKNASKGEKGRIVIMRSQKTT
jgi:type IV secretory pathway TrbL component